jgi:hypothetical protein
MPGVPIAIATDDEPGVEFDHLTEIYDPDCSFTGQSVNLHPPCPQTDRILPCVSFN